jgi:Flp pilus assembly protein TadG
MKPTERRRQRGTQVVELAIVLPLLAFLALLVTEGSDFIRVHEVLNNAAREGARLSAQTGMKGATSSVVSQVQNYITTESGGRVNGANATVTVVQNLLIPTNYGSGPVNIDASQVTVTYAYQFKYLPNFVTGGLPVNLQASAEFGNMY